MIAALSSRGPGILACVLLAAGLVVLTPAPAGAARPQDGGQSAPGKSLQPTLKPEVAKPQAQFPEPSRVSDSNLAKELGSKGQVDPIAGLGIRSPACDRPGEIRERKTRLACEASGSPESDYPTSNYGFDVFIATGVTHPIGDFTVAFVTILNGIWLGLIFVLKLVLALLGLAFGLNPFAEGATMDRISASVLRIYDRVTDPFLSTLVIGAGIWFAWRGLVRRDLTGGAAGTIAAIALLILGLWIVHQPRESVGRIAQLSDSLALTIISAPHSGSLTRPTGSYAEAMARTWDRLVEVPFAGLDFSDVGWALSRPPPEAVERADNWFCQDIGALATIAAFQAAGSSKANEECAAFARKRYGRPRRVIDLYLRSSPGSPAREALWRYFDNDDRYKSKVAAQGGDGALTRLSMLALFAAGLLGALLLLAWLAIRLFTQAAIAFVLLLAAPFALFFPLLGDSGRRAFKAWGLALAGSLLAKVIYAAFLSIVLLGISILGRSATPATGFLLSSAFAWAVFLKRTDLVAWLTIGDAHHSTAHTLPLSGLAAFGLARRATRPAATVVTGAARQSAVHGRERLALGSRATRETARHSLRESARSLGDQRLAAARQTVARFEARHPPDPARSRQPDATPSGAATAPPDPTRSSPQATRRYEDARELVDRAERNRRNTGSTWTREDLDRFAAEDRRLLEQSGDPADHAHRAGLDRRSFEELRGPERERIETQIEAARKRDLQRAALAANPPGRIAGRGRLATERIRQGVEGSGVERREQLRRLRRDRRAREHLAPRRNLSRGA